VDFSGKHWLCYYYCYWISNLERILIHCALGAKNDGCLQFPFVDGVGTSVQQEQQFARSNRIAHLRDKFDHTFRFFRLDEKCPLKMSLRAPEETAPSLKIPAEFLEDCTERKRRAMSPTRRQVHTLTTFAKVRRSTITYPSESSKAVEKKKPLAKCSRSQPITTTPHGGSDLSLANKRREVPKRKH
jgi:hypothetical protein